MLLAPAPGFSSSLSAIFSFARYCMAPIVRGEAVVLPPLLLLLFPSFCDEDWNREKGLD